VLYLGGGLILVRIPWTKTKINKVILFFVFIWFIILFFITMDAVLTVTIWTGTTCFIFLSYILYLQRDRIFVSHADICNISWELEDADPYQFEKIVADMFRRHGYQSVKVTKKSGDVGTDITMHRKKIKYVVQVKKYGEGNKIGRPDLQRLQGSAQHFHATGMIFVTYGFFSSVAKDYANQHGIEIIDHNELLTMMGKKFDKVSGAKIDYKTKLSVTLSFIVIISVLSGYMVNIIATDFADNTADEFVSDNQHGKQIDAIGEIMKNPDAHVNNSIVIKGYLNGCQQYREGDNYYYGTITDETGIVAFFAFSESTILKCVSCEPWDNYYVEDGYLTPQNYYWEGIFRKKVPETSIKYYIELTDFYTV